VTTFEKYLSLVLMLFWLPEGLKERRKDHTIQPFFLGDMVLPMAGCSLNIFV
jgi:hypothetical protein